MYEAGLRERFAPDRLKDEQRFVGETGSEIRFTWKDAEVEEAKKL